MDGNINKYININILQPHSGILAQKNPAETHPSHPSIHPLHTPQDVWKCDAFPPCFLRPLLYSLVLSIFLSYYFILFRAKSILPGSGWKSCSREHLICLTRLVWEGQEVIKSRASGRAMLPDSLEMLQLLLLCCMLLREIQNWDVLDLHAFLQLNSVGLPPHTKSWSSTQNLMDIKAVGP